ncbi:hypothetical protein HY468_00435 [Candidatus Roizmanbacteria bacterium]|nr:hypothetical protein [Candidatus Roizmanbacteria bacterium]
MNTQFQTTSIIRQRGQLTIPDSIRGKTHWVRPGSVVTVTNTKPDEIVITPHSGSGRIIDWAKLLKDMRRIRAFKGKGKGNLSQFIAKDRKSHF